MFPVYAVELHHKRGTAKFKRPSFFIDCWHICLSCEKEEGRDAGTEEEGREGEKETDYYLSISLLPSERWKIFLSLLI